MSGESSMPAAGPEPADRRQDELYFTVNYCTAVGIADLLRMAGESKADFCIDTLSNVGFGLRDILKRMQEAYYCRPPRHSGCPSAIERALSATGWVLNGKRWARAGAPDAAFDWWEAAAFAIVIAGASPVPDVGLMADISTRAVAGKAGDEGVQP